MGVGKVDRGVGDGVGVGKEGGGWEDSYKQELQLQIWLSGPRKNNHTDGRRQCLPRRSNHTTKGVVGGGGGWGWGGGVDGGVCVCGGGGGVEESKGAEVGMPA